MITESTIKQTDSPYAHVILAAETASDPHQKLLTPQQVASLLQVCTGTVLRWARENKINKIMISKKTIRFSETQIMKFIQLNTQEGTPCDSSKKNRKLNATDSKITAKGGFSQRSRKSWSDLRKEVLSCRSGKEENVIK
jgi:excisionase family DNA binding protein